MRIDKKSPSRTLDENGFCWVKEAGNPSCVRQAGGDDETAFVHAPRPAREKALARIPATSPFPLERIEQADLPAVGMTGKNQVNSVRHQREVFWMMATPSNDVPQSLELKGFLHLIPSVTLPFILKHSKGYLRSFPLHHDQENNTDELQRRTQQQGGSFSVLRHQFMLHQTSWARMRCTFIGMHSKSGTCCRSRW